MKHVVLPSFCLMLLAVSGCKGCREQHARTHAILKTKPAPSVQTACPSAEKFHGLDLTKAPRTTRESDLPDLWEERSEGSDSFIMRNDVRRVYSGFDGAVYHILEKNCFYVQHDPYGSSTMTYFGPFGGDPTKILKLESDLTPKSPSLLPTDIRGEALATCAAHGKAIKAGTEKRNAEIPPVYWADRIRALNPIRIYTHRVNIVIVQRVGDGTEEGKYIYNPLSSYLPETGDDGFVFNPNPRSGDTYTLGDGVFDFKRTINK